MHAWPIGLTFWWLRRVFIRKRECELEQAPLPNGLFPPWYAHLPILEVKHAVSASYGSCEEAERMIATPLFPVVVCKIMRNLMTEEQRAHLSSWRRLRHRDMVKPRSGLAEVTDLMRNRDGWQERLLDEKEA